MPRGHDSNLAAVNQRSSDTHSRDTSSVYGCQRCGSEFGDRARVVTEEDGPPIPAVFHHADLPAPLRGHPVDQLALGRVRQAPSECGARHVAVLLDSGSVP
jgi:hypothetical protein